MTLFDRVFGGNDAVYGLTEGAIDGAIAQYGEDKAVSFPNTAYSLPCYYAVTGTKVTTLKELKEAGYDLHFYRLAKNEFEMAEQDPEVKMIRLATIDKMDTVAVIGALPATIPAAEFAIPEKGISELTKEIEECQRQNAECDEILKKAAVYDASFQAQMLKAQNEENYSSASETAESDEDFVWISGYLPEEDLPKFKEAASANKWAWAQEDVAEDDDQVPTKVKYGKVSGLIQPVFDILGV